MLFSTFDAQYIFDRLIGKLEDRDLSFQVKPNKWKLTYEKEGQDEEDMPQLYCKVSVKISKMDKNLCIEFSRLGGDSMFFFEEFQIMRDALDYLDNAKLN